MATNNELVEIHEDGDPTLEHVLGVLHGIRAALADLLHSSGCDPSKTRETARRLELSRGLVWRLSTIVSSNDMSVVAEKLPSRKSAEALFAACRNHGAPAERIDELRAALQRFEQAVEGFSGDRRSLGMILNNVASEDLTDQQEEARKLAVQANGTIWGVQAKLQVRSCFLAPGGSSDQPTLSYASVAGLIDLNRLRSIPWPIYVASTRSNAGENIEGIEQPIDPKGYAPDGPPVMLDYSSRPVPEIHGTNSGAATVYEVVGGALGKLGTTTILCGSLFHERPCQASSEREGEPRTMNILTHLHTPVAHLHVDVFLHKDMATELPMEVNLIDRMLHPHAAVITREEVERRKMPLTIGLRELSAGAEGAVTQHIPWYPRMIRDVCKRGNWSPHDFRGYRFEMSYPPNPTALAIEVRLSSTR